jgi:hypothetical protein
VLHQQHNKFDSMKGHDPSRNISLKEYTEVVVPSSITSDMSQSLSFYFFNEANALTQI